jgi:hypothetical protein
MHIINNTIYFKSDEPYYTKEKSGIKSNTVRILSKSDINVLLLICGIQNIKRINITGIKSNTVRILSKSDINVLLLICGIQNIKRINIMNTDKKDSFTRELSDISTHYDNFIFSWA